MLSYGYGIFARRDAAHLGEDFEIEFLPVKNLKAEGLLRLFFDLCRARQRSDAIHVVFADLHFAVAALFCWIFGKKVAVHVGGYDANYVDEISYGIHPHGRRARAVGWALRQTNAIFPVHESLVEYQTDYVYPRRTGLLVRYPDLPREIIHILPHGYAGDFWRSNIPSSSRPRRVICVGTIMSDETDGDDPDARQTIRLKGLDLILKAAALLPDVEFLLLAVTYPRSLLKNSAMTEMPSNVRIEGWLSQEELRERYSSSHVFVTAALSEGHSNPLCEAMLCGCVPVGTPVNSTPDIIGETGILLRAHTPQHLADSIRQALTMDGRAARERIKERYTLEKRRDEFVRVFKEILN